MLLISVELLIVTLHPAFIPRELSGACFIGFAIGGRWAAALRIAGGIFARSPTSAPT